MMGCGSSLESLPYPSEHLTVTVFGATGTVGGPIARALLTDPRFRVKAVTRTPTNDKAHTLAEDGAVIVTCDMNDPNTLGRAVNDAHVVFLTTHFWEHRNKEKEIKQGTNVIDAVAKAGVKHLIFNGAENTKDVIGKECRFLDTKAFLEDYIKEKGVPCTFLHLPFFYENFLHVYHPHKLDDDTYTIALPMGNSTLNMICINDIGKCVMKILLKPKAYINKTIYLASDRMTTQQIADTFTKHFDGLSFTDPKIRIKDYERFTFVGAKDLGAMFEYYQHRSSAYDLKMTRKLNSGMPSFDKWVHENKDKIEKVLF